MLIGGEWGDSKSKEVFESINPYTEKPWATIPRGSSEDGAAAVEAAHHAFHFDWSQMTPTERGKRIVRLGELVASKAEDLARVEVRDNGKLFAEMLGQLRYVPEWYTYFGGLADKIEGATIPIDKSDSFGYTVYEPYGVVCAIIPWNSPLLITAWKLAPALAAGNTVVLKPSEHASASVLEFAKLFEEAGLPAGTVNVVTGFGDEIGESLVSHPKVAKVSFTGGEAGGKSVYTIAAQSLKKVTLELGGKSPNIVFADANLENAVKGGISGIFAASGQTCIAGSRLLVEASIHDQFIEQLVELAKTAKMGDPMSSDTQVGPITTRAQYEKVLEYIDIAKSEGATCVLGGKAGQGPGWFVEPSIFTGVNNSMRIAQEEVFGPILSVIPFQDEEEAVQLANETPYGLAAGIWTSDLRRAMRLPKKISAGTVWVNTYRAISYMMPFGGYKRSGLGRESGKTAIYDYLQTKSVWISAAEDVPNPFVMR